MDDASPPRSFAASVAAAANLTPVPISGPFLLAHLGFVAQHTAETVAVVIGRARG